MRFPSYKMVDPSSYENVIPTEAMSHFPSHRGRGRAKIHHPQLRDSLNTSVLKMVHDGAGLPTILHVLVCFSQILWYHWYL